MPPCPRMMGNRRSTNGLARWKSQGPAASNLCQLRNIPSRCQPPLHRHAAAWGSRSLGTLARWMSSAHHDDGHSQFCLVTDRSARRVNLCRRPPACRCPAWDGFRRLPRSDSTTSDRLPSPFGSASSTPRVLLDVVADSGSGALQARVVRSPCCEFAHFVAP